MIPSHEHTLDGIISTSRPPLGIIFSCLGEIVGVGVDSLIDHFVRFQNFDHFQHSYHKRNFDAVESGILLEH